MISCTACGGHPGAGLDPIRPVHLAEIAEADDDGHRQAVQNIDRIPLHLVRRGGQALLVHRSGDGLPGAVDRGLDRDTLDLPGM